MLALYPDRVNPGERSGFRRVRSNRNLTTAKVNASFDEGQKKYMRAMRTEGFSGYKDLKLVDIPKPAVSDGRVLVRITAAGSRPSTIRFSPDNTTSRRRR